MFSFFLTQEKERKGKKKATSIKPSGPQPPPSYEGAAATPNDELLEAGSLELIIQYIRRYGVDLMKKSVSLIRYSVYCISKGRFQVIRTLSPIQNIPLLS